MNTEGCENKISRKCIREVQLYLRYKESYQINQEKSVNLWFKIVLHDGSELVSGNILLVDLHHQTGRNIRLLSGQHQHAPGSLGVWELHLPEKHQRCNLQSDEPDHQIIQYVVTLTDNQNIITAGD